MKTQALLLVGLACAFAEAVPWTIYNNDIPGRMTFDSAQSITLTSDPVPRAASFPDGYARANDFSRFAGTIIKQRENEVELASQIAKETRRSLPACFELRLDMSQGFIPESCERVMHRINALASTQGLSQVSHQGMAPKRLSYNPMFLLEDYVACRTDLVFNSLYLGVGDVTLLDQSTLNAVPLTIPYLSELARTSRWRRSAQPKEENKSNTLVFGSSGSVIQKTSSIAIPFE